MDLLQYNICDQLSFFQKVVWLDAPEGQFEIDGGLLRGELDLAPYLIATREITNFVCDKVNPEFGQDSFDFPEGAVLACYHQDPYYVDREVFSNITSIFDYVESEEIKKELTSVKDTVSVFENEIKKRRLYLYK